ncbi:MAG: hypothetical protein ACI9NC_000286, partial [Verrucomicrobiales bacterium]
AAVNAIDPVLEIDFHAGNGNQDGTPDPATRAAIVAGLTTNAGQKGVALLNLSTGNYDAVYFHSAQGGATETTSLTLADLTAAGVSTTDNYRLDFYEDDDGSWGWTRLEEVRLDAAAITGGANFNAFWDFSDEAGGDQGWEAVNGFASFAADGVHASTNGADFAEDASHTTLLFRSPMINFSATAPDDVAIEVDFIGGQGNQSASPAPANPAAVLAHNGGSSNASGQKGLAFLNLITGNYDHVIYDSENGGDNPETISFTLAELITAGVDAAADYRLDFFEHDDGTSGWTRLESVNLNAVVTPDPPEFTVFWDFSDTPGGDHGWEAVNGFASFAADGVHASTNGTDFAEDATHTTLIFQSPIVNFSATPPGDLAIEVDFIGGQGNQNGSPAPATPDVVLANNGGISNASGQKGLAFFNLTTGNYDGVIYDSEDGGANPESIRFTLAELTTAGIDAAADYRLDFFEHDDGASGWTRLESVNLNAVVKPDPDPPSGADLVWDFSPGNEHGWTTINGVSWIADNGVEAAQADGDGIDAYFGGINASGNTRRSHDGAHVNLIYRSPVINFGGVDPIGSVLEIDFHAGNGNQDGTPDPFNPPAVGMGISTDAGQKGVGLLNLSTGNYDAVYFHGAQGGATETTSLTLDDLTGAGVSTTDNYQLDFYDNDDGSWGWTRLEEVRLDGAALGEAAGGFAITAIDYSPGDNSVTLTWNSNETARYAVKYSKDLKDWGADLDDSIVPDAGEQTVKTFDLVPAGLVGAGRVYFRVERLPPG